MVHSYLLALDRYNTSSGWYTTLSKRYSSNQSNIGTEFPARSERYHTTKVGEIY